MSRHPKKLRYTHQMAAEIEDNSLIETVYIPQGYRGTVCLSSQVGCTLNCSFCYTGTQKLSQKS